METTSSRQSASKEPTPNRLSQFFAFWARLSYDHHRKVLTMVGLFLIAMAALVTQLTMDMAAENRLHKNDPVRVHNDEFRRTFGRDDIIVISIPIGGDIDDRFVTKLQHLQQEIEQVVPYVHKQTSLINANFSFGDNGELNVEALLEDWPATPISTRWPASSLKNYLMTNPSFRNRLISESGSHTAIVVELDAEVMDEAGSMNRITEAQSGAAVEAIRQVLLSQSMNGGFKDDVSLSGTPVVQETLNRLVFNGTNITSSLALIVTIGFLMFFFRRISGVLIPLLIIISSMVAALGFMVINGAAWTLTMGIIPAILIATGVADAVHILTEFYKTYRLSGVKRSAIIDAISHTAPAVLLTSVTTAAGFLSFAAADLASIKELGIYSAIAVSFALLFTVTLIPALLAQFNIRQHTGKDADAITIAWVETFTQACVRFSCRYPKAISSLSLIILVLGSINAAQLSMSDDILGNFADSEVTKQDFLRTDALYKGAGNLEIVIDSGSERGIVDPAFMAKLEQASIAFSNTTINGVNFADSHSVLNILKETHKALNNNDEAFYTLAGSRELIAQELLLFEMSQRDDLLDVIDNDFRHARLTLKMQYADSVVYHDIIRFMQDELDSLFGPGKTHITGTTALVAESIPRALSSMMSSYGISLIVITVFMVLMIGDIRLGLLSMIPNLLPIVLILNLMLLLDWPLDQTTISIGAIALGLVVDDTLHFLYHFKQYWKKTGNASESAMASVRGCGTAMFITSVIFASASMTNTLSSLNGFIIFGISLGLITVLALIFEFLITPALLVSILDGKKRKVSELSTTEETVKYEL